MMRLTLPALLETTRALVKAVVGQHAANAAVLVGPRYRLRHRWLCQVLRGHYRYYGVIFNSRALRAFQTCVVKLWRKTLGKRSQKGHVTWASYQRLLTVFPLPEPVIHQAWHR